MKYALVAVALIVVSAGLIVWGLTRRHARDLFIESAIKPPQPRFVGHNDKLRERADRRRAEAEEARRRAAFERSGEWRQADVRTFGRREA